MGHHGGMAESKRVVVLAFPGVQMLDVTGPAEVFSIATRLGHASYELAVVARDEAPVPASSGLRLVPDGGLKPLREVDTLVIPGGEGTREAYRDEALVNWIRRAAKRSRRVTSVCTGAFLLAKAGLLDGRRATTHWSACAALSRRYPSITVEDDPIFVRDEHVWTSAGVTAGMDLALALVEEDAGKEAALEVARQLVLFVRRPGGQAQFSAQLSADTAEREPLRELQAWIADHLTEDLTVEALAARAHMSPRNFARAFKAEIGMTPAAYVERARVERAQQALQASHAPVALVARSSGFGTVGTMRRAFQRRTGASPVEYRDRFAA
jgi:transcriptional regulator GlxA family with amidase domain